MLYNQGKKATSKLKLFAGFVGALMMTATSYAANITVTGGVNDIDGNDTVTVTLINVQPGDADFGGGATGTGYLVNGARTGTNVIGYTNTYNGLSGVASITTSTGTNTPDVNDTFTIAGDGQTYTVTSVVGTPGTGFTLGISPNLVLATTGVEAITFSGGVV
jgi:hypothetical protein